MKECVYYHWFACKEDSPAYANLRAPAIVSIATLRAVSDVPIVVLDISDQATDWGGLDQKLKFTSIQIKPELERYRGLKGWQHLSRLFDLEKYASSETVIYSDSDVFWMKDPLPLTQKEGFCFDGYNTGFFYYKRPLEKFFEVFKAYTIGALNNENIRRLMKSHIGYDAWHFVFDEMITTYISKENKELVAIIPPEEHGCPRRFQSTSLSEMKNLHFNGVYVRNPVFKNELEKDHCRGLAGLIIGEFAELLEKALGEDIKRVFTEQEIRYASKRRFSLVREPECLLNTLRSDGHYHLTQHKAFLI